MPANPDLVLDGLTGCWSLTRIVHGNDTNQGSMQGIATFRRLESGLMAYREEGRLLLPSGETFDAFRDYLYNRISNGFAVFFCETPPRLFHEIKLRNAGTGALVGTADHRCGDDHYATRYAFQPDGGFDIRHDVRGPRKDYTMTTHYARIAPLPSP